ncbi:MAG: SAM-dependent methyltransferase [Candidatus Obscuribacterales bacterium]|nr:SAM-dependent methyltransferase [Steroidobacteraceae bacterium]
MPFTLDQVAPWGRSFDEYVAMFALTPADLRRRIVGCGDGPAAFNSVANKTGGGVVSVDPIYEFSVDQLRQRIDAIYDSILAETERNKDEFVWQHVKSVEELGRLRKGAMEEFLTDYPQGVKEYRYVAGELPLLPFMDQTYELALCSHFLFLYSEHHDLDFHIASIKELCRVAEEVRIFPLLELGSRKSRHLDAVIAALEQDGFLPEIVTVNYEFQKGGNQMLRLGGSR